MFYKRYKGIFSFEDYNYPMTAISEVLSFEHECYFLSQVIEHLVLTSLDQYWSTRLIIMNRQLPTNVTWGAGIANPSEAPEFTPCFWWSSCCSIFSFLFCGPFSFGYCIACPSSIYIFWFTLWYLQTSLALNRVANYTSQTIRH
jgi:hypothetical protein